MAGGKSPRKSRVWWLVGAVLLAVGLGGSLVWVRPWADSVMSVTVTVSTDEKGPVTLSRKQTVFSSRGGPRPVIVAEAPLSQWEGQLVRVDVAGEVKRRIGLGSQTGDVGCRAELVSPAGRAPLEFVGWPRRSRADMHLEPAGSPAFVTEEGGGQQFLYSNEGRLWHVLRVPTKAALRLSLTPVLFKDATGRPVASAPAMQTPKPWKLTTPTKASDPPPDVFIYLIDAVRADHLGCYGYDRGTSPAIDEFAATATLYEEAQTASTWTRPSVATLLSGLYPSVHGAMHMSDGLAEWPTLLPEILQEAGYRTCAVTTNGNVNSQWGYEQGYDTFVFRNRRSAAWVNLQASQFLARQPARQPVFMYLHTVEPHSPYTPRPDSFRRFDRGLKGACDGSLEALEAVGHLRPRLSAADVGHLIDLYDAEILEADQGFAGFLDLLRNTGRLDNALIVLLSDHGESFAEHETLQHGFNLNQEELHVPLVIRFPRGRLAGVRVSRRVSLIDVLPTLLREVGVAAHLTYTLPGTDLTAAAEHPTEADSREIYAEVAKPDGNTIDLVAVIDRDGYKRVMSLAAPEADESTKKSVGLWETRADAEEEHDQIESMPVTAALGEQLIARWLMEQKQQRRAVSAGPAPKVEMSEEMRKQLRALGYLR